MQKGITLLIIYDIKLMLIDMLRWKGTSTFSFNFLGLRDISFDPSKFCSVVSACLPASPFSGSVQFFSAFSHCQNAHLEILLGVLLGCPCGCPPCTVNPGLGLPSNLPHPGHNGQNGYASNPGLR